MASIQVIIILINTAKSIQENAELAVENKEEINKLSLCVKPITASLQRLTEGNYYGIEVAMESAIPYVEKVLACICDFIEKSKKGKSFVSNLFGAKKSQKIINKLYADLDYALKMLNVCLHTVQLENTFNAVIGRFKKNVIKNTLDKAKSVHNVANAVKIQVLSTIISETNDPELRADYEEEKRKAENELESAV